MSNLKSPPSGDQGSCLAPRSSWLEADVVCGLNFSDYSAQAGLAAVALAERLVIVHAVETAPGVEDISGDAWKPITIAASHRVHVERDILRALHMATVESALRSGDPVVAILEEAKNHASRLLVVGAAHERAHHLWPGATVAEVVAETAELPTLVVRRAAPFLQWVRGERPLRVFVAMDFSPPSEAALRWVDWLRLAGPCDIVAASLETDSPAAAGAETVPSLFMNEFALKSAHAQERLFDSEVRTRFGLANVSTRFENSTRNTGAKLVQLAVQHSADLIVVGTHSRNGWHRIGHHSISRFILRHAPVNVLVCPAEQPAA